MSGLNLIDSIPLNMREFDKKKLHDKLKKHHSLELEAATLITRRNGCNIKIAAIRTKQRILLKEMCDLVSEKRV